jgi:transcription initiation factor TFIID subunit 5
MISSLEPKDGHKFFDAHSNMFLPEYADDLRVFESLQLPEHVQENAIAKKYRSDKYRLTLSTPAYTNLIQFLESKKAEGGTVMTAILSSYCKIITKERSADDRFSFAAILARANEAGGFPAEDEGIPGHHPGSAYTGENPALEGTLPRLKLGKLPLEPVLEGDVRGDLADLDAKEPPVAGRPSLVEHFDQMIKKEDDEESPSRADIPYPPSTARDVSIEVQKVIENRDRFKIEGRTGGVGPGISVCMFTFHNTYDRYGLSWLLSSLLPLG